MGAYQKQRTATAAAAIAVISFCLAGLSAAGSLALPPRQDPAATEKPASLLTSRYSREFLARQFAANRNWRPFPAAEDRTAWDALLAQPLNQQRMVFLVKAAEGLQGKPWPALPATLYMEYARTGNRSRFEQAYFQRRENLGTLVLAECFEHRGRFLDEIANGLWVISEEATWCLPAHAARLPKDVLHRQDLESVDLFAAETAMTLATARYLLRREMEALSPALTDRIGREVLRRVVQPVESGDGFGSSWWLDGRNNWSPWCASNVLGAGLLLIEDPQRLAGLAHRMMGVADRFIDRYGSDGGCDEGPGYWNEAAGALVVLLELLHSRTAGAVSIYDHVKVAAMGDFIVHARLAGPWFYSYADADAKTTPHPGKVYRFGERVKSEGLKGLALFAMRSWKLDAPVDPPLQMSGVSRALLGPLMEIFWVPADTQVLPIRVPTTSWIPSIQMLVARESSTEPQTGLLLAARGGHNAESHNHNDVGHFVVFLDGRPGIIDVGRETYTAQTFSGNRYDLWFTRGSAHNAPLVNGFEQKDGREYQATRVEFLDQASSQRLSMNLERAYPAEAGIESLRRDLLFLRGANAQVQVRDNWTLSRSPSNMRYVFYTAAPVEQLQPGRLAVLSGQRRLLFEFDPPGMAVRLEPVTVADETLRRNWGDRLYRIILEYQGPGASGAIQFRFRAE
ncbi:MAG: hypothetical protein H6Q05_2315 [Acidobacteria bacterium]|nr:hypothetical protein [Acidobacteriota bacterium]